LTTQQFGGINVFDNQPFFCDIDGDGDLDLFVGSSEIPDPPHLYLFRNMGTPGNPNYVLYSDDFLPNNYFVIITPTLADIDADGDLDLFVSDDYGDFYFHRNNGTPRRPRFQFETMNWQGIDMIYSHSYNDFYDIDADGDLDLFIMSTPYGIGNGSNVAYYKNIGTPQQAQMVLQTDVYLPYSILYACPRLCDIDADGFTDLFVGSYNGGISFFHGIGDDPFMKDTVKFVMTDNNPQFTIGPNPANPSAFINLQLPTPQNINLGVYNLQGQLVKSLASGVYPAGQNNFNWNASANSSGTYFVRLETPDKTTTRKLTVVK
jgi:hypothetical protein